MSETIPRIKLQISDKVKEAIEDLQAAGTWYDETIAVGKIYALLALRDFIQYLEVPT